MALPDCPGGLLDLGLLVKLSIVVATSVITFLVFIIIFVRGYGVAASTTHSPAEVFIARYLALVVVIIMLPVLATVIVVAPEFNVTGLKFNVAEPEVAVPVIPAAKVTLNVPAWVIFTVVEAPRSTGAPLAAPDPLAKVLPVR